MLRKTAVRLFSFPDVTYELAVNNTICSGPGPSGSVLANEADDHYACKEFCAEEPGCIGFIISKTSGLCYRKESCTLSVNTDYIWIARQVV